MKVIVTLSDIITIAVCIIFGLIMICQPKHTRLMVGDGQKAKKAFSSNIIVLMHIATNI